MTLEKLLQKSAKELDALSVEELEAWFKPMLVVTRPELAPKPQKTLRKVEREREYNSVKKQALDILKQHGVNIKPF